MKTMLKNVFLNNINLKVFSLIFGYLTWSFIGHSHSDSAWITVPVCFASCQTNLQVTAPENVRVHLAGKRCDLQKLDTNTTAVHIDTRDLKEGEQRIELSDHHVLIPDSLHVIGWAPTHIHVLVKKEQTNT